MLQFRIGKNIVLSVHICCTYSYTRIVTGGSEMGKEEHMHGSLVFVITLQ
jgi:hypothetical protein